MQTFPKKYNIHREYEVYQQRQWHEQEEKVTSDMKYLLTYHPLLWQQYDIYAAIHLYIIDVIYKLYSSVWKKLQRNVSLDLDLFAIKTFILQRIKDWDMHTLQRNTLNVYVQEYIHEQEKKYLHSLSQIGIMPTGMHYCYSEVSMNQVRKVFVKLYEEWMIQEQKNVMPRSMQHQIILSEDELMYVKERQILVYIRYFIDTKKDVLVVPTLHPETIFGDVALAVNPLDKRYKKFVGKYVIIPIINKTIPIVADESIDMTKHTGVYRVTPWHDAFGLEIAKRHGLSIDIHAFDQYGYYTERAGVFVGKKVEQFKENVYQYLDDIANLDSTVEVEETVVYAKKTWERVEHLLMKQWFFDVKRFVARIQSLLSDRKWPIIPQAFEEHVQKILAQNSFWCISRHLPFGSVLPVWYSSEWKICIVDTQQLAQAYTTTKKAKGFEIAYIILQSIYDGRLPVAFSLDELIDALFSPSSDPTYAITLDAYVDLLRSEFPKLLDQSIIKELQTWSSAFHGSAEIAQELVQAVAEVVDEWFWIISTQEKYTIDLSVWWIKDDVPNLVSDSTYDSLFVYVAHVYAALQEDKIDFCSFIEQQKINSRLTKILVFLWSQSSEIKNTTTVYSVWDYVTATQCNMKDPRFQHIDEMIQFYGSDVVRYSILQASHDVSLPLDQHVDIHNQSINKLWNAVRYMTTTHIWEQKKGTFSTKEILKDILKNWDSLQEFDMWILFQLHTVQTYVQEHYATDSLSTIVQKVSKLCFEDFCESYVEISKILPSEYTGKISLYVASEIIKLMYPYMPFVACQLWDHIAVEGVITQGYTIADIHTQSKNYKIHLFMNIVDAYRWLKLQLAIPKHQDVDMYIQATPDFLQFMQQYKSCIEKLIRTSSFSYIRAGVEEPVGYTTTNVIDIILWLKVAKQIDQKVSLGELQKMLAQKKEYMQYLRSLLISHPQLSKQQEMDELKNQIENLEFELSKKKIK